MKRVMVAVKSVQRDIAGEDTVIELVSPGKYYERGGVKYIRYEESEVTGLEGVQTTIKVYPTSIVLLRNGKVTMRHYYELGKERESVYKTPFGNLKMVVNTHELTTDITDGIGRVHLGYDISVGGDWQFYNQLDIELREDAEYGNEGRAETGH
ncbi:DUF1934 domain-containing protein [Veillonella magna]|uniref:DUF1934 domain-containing protein n=1 Tax=Veillonella magna TaxID=464322 RepID=UPI0023F1698A|nr:DUF1934 domain-containing protein [Veillonella magna]